MTKLRVFGFGTFLELRCHLQSTRSRRLVNEFWWFLVQNKIESLLVLFLLFPVHFRWVEINENVQWNKKLRVFLVQTPKMEANVQVDPRWVHWKNQLEYLEIVNVYRIDNLEVFCILLKLYTSNFRDKQISLGCDPQDQEKPGSGTRNENAYLRGHPCPAGVIYR